MKIYNIYMLLLLPFICSCFMHKKDNYSTIEMSTVLQISISFSKNDIYKDSIGINIINRNEKALIVGSPKYWGNVVCSLKDAEGNIVPSVKIKVNPKYLTDTITLSHGTSMKYYFSYSLYDLYPGIKTGTYEVHFIYQGGVKDLNGNEVLFKEQIRSSDQKIEIIN